jgi:glycosyltransferase involved in cell wall biosynthesis
LLRLFEQVLDVTSPDVVHVQHLMGLPVSLLKRLQHREIPFVITLHDYWWLCANAQLLTNDTEEVCDGPRLWINCGRCALARANQTNALWLAPTIAPLFASRHRLLHYILRQAGQLIVPTAFTREVYAQIGMIEREKVQIIPNGIKVPEATTFHEQLATHQDSEPKRLHIAYVGGIAQQKGVHLLIKAVTELPVGVVRLSIYGDTTTFPDYVSELRQMATPNVEFMGRVANHLLLSKLANADVLVVPSIWYETAGIVIQEAYAVGVPVIASDLGALRDRVRHEIDGLRFPAGNWQALRDTLLRLLEEPSLLTRLRTNIQMNDTTRNQVNAIEAVYQRVTSS